MNAEVAYLFRHALMRDAAYQLQLPTDRARLHELALDVTEQVAAKLGVRAAEVFAAEMAVHARLANAHNRDDLALRELSHLRSAAAHARVVWDTRSAVHFSLAVADHRLCDVQESLRSRTDAARLMLELAQNEEAEAQIRRARDEAARAGLREDEATAGEILGDVLRATGRTAQAVEQFKSCVMGSGKPAHECAPLLVKVALISQRDSDIEAAAEALEQALLRRDLPPRERAKYMLGLAAMYRRLRRLEQTFELSRQAVAAVESGSDRLLYASMLNSHANVLMYLGRLDEAERVYAQSIETAQACGAVRTALYARSNLAVLNRRRGRVDRTERQLREVVAALRELGDDENEADNHRLLALLLIEQERHAEAREELAVALKMARQAGARMIEAKCLAYLARTVESLEDPARALEAFERADEFARRHGDSALQAETGMGLAIAHSALGNESCAQALWTANAEIFLKFEGAEVMAQAEKRLARARALRHPER